MAVIFTANIYNPSYTPIFSSVLLSGEPGRLYSGGGLHARGQLTAGQLLRAKLESFPWPFS